MRVVLLDNRDSFVYNLVDQFATLGSQIEVYRNNVPASRVLAALASAGFLAVALRAATASVAAGGTLGSLIPPSVLMAIYAIVAEQSLVKLYAAAFIPGFVLAALYVVTVWIVALIRPDWIPRIESMPWKVRLRASVGMWKLGVLFFFAVFGIYLGWFSPTEAAAMAVRVQPHQRFGNPQVREQRARAAGVLAGDGVGQLQHVQCAQGDVREVADRLFPTLRERGLRLRQRRALPAPVGDLAQPRVEGVIARRQAKLGAHQLHGRARPDQRACDERQRRLVTAVARQ